MSSRSRLAQQPPSAPPSGPPFGQHAEFLQVSLVAHLFPQLPQLLSSVLVSTHPFPLPQQVRPAPQGVPQVTQCCSLV